MHVSVGANEIVWVGEQDAGGHGLQGDRCIGPWCSQLFVVFPS